MTPLSRPSRNQNNYLSLDNGLKMSKCRKCRNVEGFLSLSLIFTIIIVLLNKEKKQFVQMVTLLIIGLVKGS